MDHNGFPLTGAPTASGFGVASGVTGLTSTLAGGPMISLGRISSVPEGAARHAAAQPAVKKPQSVTNAQLLGNLTNFSPVAFDAGSGQL